MTQAELNRYDRHLRLPEIGLAGQQRLKQARVAIVGAGGLGCPVAQYLTAAGVGTLGIIDGDVVEASNLQRQILFSPEHIGQSKATVAAAVLARQNPYCEVEAIPFFWIVPMPSLCWRSTTSLWTVRQFRDPLPGQ